MLRMEMRKINKIIKLIYKFLVISNFFGSKNIHYLIVFFFNKLACGQTQYYTVL